MKKPNQYQVEQFKSSISVWLDRFEKENPATYAAAVAALADELQARLSCDAGDNISPFSDGLENLMRVVSTLLSRADEFREDDFRYQREKLEVGVGSLEGSFARVQRDA